MALSELARPVSQVGGVEGEGGVLGQCQQQVHMLLVEVPVVDGEGARPTPAGAGPQEEPAGGTDWL